MIVHQGCDKAVQYYTAGVETGEIKQVVEATGTINAVITVPVGSQVAGAISKLYLDFNSLGRGLQAQRLTPLSKDRRRAPTLPSVS